MADGLGCPNLWDAFILPPHRRLIVERFHLLLRSVLPRSRVWSLRVPRLAFAAAGPPKSRRSPHYEQEAKGVCNAAIAGELIGEVPACARGYAPGLAVTTCTSKRNPGFSPYSIFFQFHATCKHLCSPPRVLRRVFVVRRSTRLGRSWFSAPSRVYMFYIAMWERSLCMSGALVSCSCAILFILILI